MLKTQIDEAFPDFLCRLEELTEDYSPTLPPSFDQLKEIVWPKDLTEQQQRLVRGAVVEYSDRKRGKDVFECNTVLGIQWDDEVNEYYALLWKHGTPQPQTLKEVKHFAYLGPIFLPNGEQQALSLFEFDNFRIIEAGMG